MKNTIYAQAILIAIISPNLHKDSLATDENSEQGANNSFNFLSTSSALVLAATLPFSLAVLTAL